MSVINQLLLDLEKRRACVKERNPLPSYVRAIPLRKRSMHKGWIAACGTAAALAGLWSLLSGYDGMHPRVNATDASQRGTEAIIEKVVAVSAGVNLDVNPGGDKVGAPKVAPAARLSFELSNPPDQSERHATRVPIPTARVLNRAGLNIVSKSDTPIAQVERKDSDKWTVPVVTTVAAETRSGIQKVLRQPTPRELAENEYRSATALLYQGRLAEAQEGYQWVLSRYPGNHGARQALVGLLLEEKKYSEAERVLEDGLTLAPVQPGFAMTLARLQVDRGEAAKASATLKKGLEYAQDSADYLAFHAALLQRQGRHEEAIDQFRGALRLRPATGVWWLGLGISLQAANRMSEAQDAFRRASISSNLNPELVAFAEQRLKQLQ